MTDLEELYDEVTPAKPRKVVIRRPMRMHTVEVFSEKENEWATTYEVDKHGTSVPNYRMNMNTGNGQNGTVETNDAGVWLRTRWPDGDVTIGNGVNLQQIQERTEEILRISDPDRETLSMDRAIASSPIRTLAEEILRLNDDEERALDPGGRAIDLALPRNPEEPPIHDTNYAQVEARLVAEGLCEAGFLTGHWTAPYDFEDQRIREAQIREDTERDIAEGRAMAKRVHPWVHWPKPWMERFGAWLNSEDDLDPTGGVGGFLFAIDVGIWCIVLYLLAN